MKRMIRYGMKPVRYRIVVINVLLALALTLLVNFSFFLIGADPPGGAAADPDRLRRRAGRLFFVA